MNKFFISLLLLSSISYADIISVRADEWCPYNCTPGETPKGYMIEIVEKILTDAGHTLDYQIAPWSRAIKETREGKFVSIIGASKDDAADFIFPSAAQGATKSCYFVNKDSTWKYTDLESVKKIKLGGILDYAYGDALDEYAKANMTNADKIDFIGGENALEVSVKKLIAGRIDVFIEDPNVMTKYLKANKLVGSLKKEGCEGNTTPIYIAFGPKNPKAKEYAKIISDGMTKLKASGELKKILDDYGVDGW